MRPQQVVDLLAQVEIGWNITGDVVPMMLELGFAPRKPANFGKHSAD